MDATPYAWTEPEDAAQGEAIGAYLRDLVSWKPGLGRWGEGDVESPPGPSDAAPAPSWSPPREPSPAEPEPEPPDAWSEAAVEELSSWEPPSEIASAAETPADPWLQGPAEADEAAQEQEEWTPLELEPHMEVAPEQVPANAPPPQQPRPDRDDDEEDEDLEMFRSWLQSLKK